MHLVLINQYYPPDGAPTGLMLEAVAEAMALAGHRVTVLCAAGGYAGAKRRGRSPPSPGVRVVRVGATQFGRGTQLGKLADYLSFYAGTGWRLATLRPRPDRVVALTTPPYLSVLARIFSKLRGADHAHWVMDLYPDVMVAHGMLDEGGVPHRLLAALARFGYGGGRCAAVVTLGPDMAERVATHLDHGGVAKWVPLWGTGAGRCDREAVRALRTERGWRDDELVLMYSGNMGLGHRFDEFLAAAATLASVRRSPSIRFVFFGGGKRRGEIEEFIGGHPDARVELHDYVSRELLAAHLCSADVHLASLEPSWEGTMLPSKLQGIYSVGRPVMFVGSRNSSTGRWIEESGGGWVVKPGDVEGLLGAVGEARDPAVRHQRGIAAREFHLNHFRQDTNTSRVTELLTCGNAR